MNIGTLEQTNPFDISISGKGWGSGFGADVILTNTSQETIDRWTVEFDSFHNISSLWNAEYTKRQNADGSYHYTVTNPSWTQSPLAPGESLSFGFNAISAPDRPVSDTLNPNNFTNFVFNGEVNPGGSTGGNPTDNNGGTSNPGNTGNTGGDPIGTQAPSKPTIAVEDNNLKDGTFTIKLNKWFGTPGSSWSIKEDGKVIYTAELSPDASTGSQSASYTITDRDYASHVYEVVLKNSYGETSSDPLVHTVGGASNIAIAGVDGQEQALQLTISQGTTEFTVDNLVADGSRYTVKTNNSDLIAASINDLGKLTITAKDSGRAALRIEDITTGETRYIGVRVKTPDGKIPGMPDYLALGSVSEDSKADLGFWQDFGDGLANKRIDARYIYLNGGPINGWRSWEDGKRLQSYIRESQKIGAVPYFVYYNIPDGGESYFTDKQHIESQDYLKGYAQDLKYALDTISKMAGDDPVGMVLEPDFIGYMAQQSGKRPQEILARTDAFYSSGVLDSQQDLDPETNKPFANNMTGLVKAINYTISKYAPNVNFGWQFNLWASPAGGFTKVGIPGKGLIRMTDTLGMQQGQQAIVNEAKEIAKYYMDAGILSNGASFISIDKYGLDAVGAGSPANDPEQGAWFWNNDHWNNYLLYSKTLHETTGLPVTLWQMPVGHINGSQAFNPYDSSGQFQDLPNKVSQYEDSAGTFFLGDTFIENDPKRLEYFSRNEANDPGLSVDGNKVTWAPHIQQAKEAGINTILFGAGVGISTDGVGSPPTDGHWWISQVQEYYQKPVLLDGNYTGGGTGTGNTTEPISGGNGDLSPVNPTDTQNPITGGNNTQDPNAGGNGTTDPNTGGNSTQDPNAAGNNTQDPNAGGGNNTTDPNAGGNVIQNPNTGDNNNSAPLGQPDYVGVNGQKDVFSFTWNWGKNNVIANFDPQQDAIDLKNFWTDYSQFNISDDPNGNAVIDLKSLNNQTITLKGVSTSQLNPENITGVSGTSPLTGNNSGGGNSGGGTDPTTPNQPPLPTLSIDDVTITEGDSGTKTAEFKVTLSAASTEPITVKYATNNGTATAGSDYTANSGTLTFNPGATSQTIGVAIKGDTQIEAVENFSVKLSDPINAQFATSSATGTILNDDRTSNTSGGSNNNKVVGAYYPEWAIYERNYQVADIPADKLTHVFYAFAKIDNTGQVTTFDNYAATEKRFDGDWNTPKEFAGNFEQLNKVAKAKNPNLKTMISIGGWTLSNKFSDVALTDASREKFASSAVKFMTKYGFDGIDIDWEYPVGGGLPSNTYRPQDKQNYTLLLKELDKQIQVQEAKDNKDYQLTIASPAGVDKIQNFELDKMSQYVDFFNVMAYDYHGAWENTTNHQAALYANPNDPSPIGQQYNIDNTIKTYLAAGAPADKIVMGAPLYGRTWGNVTPSKDGLFQAAGGAGEGSWEKGIMDYKDIYNKLQTDKSYVSYWDDSAMVPYVYNANKNFFSTYENTQSLDLKLGYVEQNKLRGMFFWDASGDLGGDNPNSLIKLASNRLGINHSGVAHSTAANHSVSIV
ncbi:MAG: glycosyl hydrolase family 18 protein [Prochloraceae cyanobacterium]|nr:glycosyl hydrolase family 18 protein [Prochloraceae cyanobacterium]